MRKLLVLICLSVITTSQAQLNSVSNKFPAAKCVQCDYAEIDPTFSWGAAKENPIDAIKYSMVTPTGAVFGNPNSTPSAFSRVSAGQFNCPTTLFGNNAYRIRLQNTGNSNTRSELYWGVGGSQFTDAQWFMAGIYIPNALCLDHRPFGLGFDFKHADAGGPAAANIKVPNGRWQLNVDYPQGSGEDKYDLGAVEKGKWTYILVNRNFEDGPNGFIRVYMWTEGTTPVFTLKQEVLGANYHEYQGENTEGYVLWGPYIWGASGNEGSGPCDAGGYTMAPSYELFYDNIIIAKSTATLSDFNNFISGATAPGNSPPSVDAGTNQSITLPTNSVALNGTVNDADGTIEGSVWTQIEGPNTATFSNAGLVDQTASNLIAGTYIFRLTSTDNDGASASDDVIVTVNSSGGTTSGPRFTLSTCADGNYLTGGCPSTPIADRSITSPKTTDTAIFYAVHGDTTGFVQSFSVANIAKPIGTTPTWNQYLPQEGYWRPTPGGFSFAGLTANGTYTFEVTVTDGQARTKKDTFDIVRSAATNTPPTVNAGSNITLTLDGFGPFNSTSTNLSATASDPDGNIASVQWVQIDGTTYGSPNSLTTTLNGLVGGTYNPRVIVTDNSGATATDDLTIRVLTCNAGANQAISLPTSTVNLVGSSSSVSDTTDVLWTKISGTGGTITSSGTLSTTVTGLSAGTYTFQLQVTHSGGFVVRDQIEVTVLPATPTTKQTYILDIQLKN